ncbi:MAG: hypothetical protein ACR2QO_21105 [Acidimicrobiales bacterium]
MLRKRRWCIAGSRAEIEALVASLAFADDGSLDAPTPPAEAGLFGETAVSFVGEDVTLVLRSYNGQVSADELVELARSVERVDDETWAERLSVAPLFDARSPTPTTCRPTTEHKDGTGLVLQRRCQAPFVAARS